jgi:hypothetical protein
VLLKLPYPDTDALTHVNESTLQDWFGTEGGYTNENPVLECWHQTHCRAEPEVVGVVVKNENAEVKSEGRCTLHGAFILAVKVERASLRGGGIWTRLWILKWGVCGCVFGKTEGQR